jgi:hypothetical protein
VDCFCRSVFRGVFTPIHSRARPLCSLIGGCCRCCCLVLFVQLDEGHLVVLNESPLKEESPFIGELMPGKYTFLANSTRGICLWTLPSTGFASLSLCLAMPSLPPSRLHRRSNRFDDPAGFDRQISQLSLIVRLRRTKRGWYCREMPSVYTVGQLMPKVKPIHSLGNRLLRPRRSSEVSSLGVNFHLSAVLTGFASSRDIAIHPQTLFVPQLRRWRCRRPATKWSASTLRSARRL